MPSLCTHFLESVVEQSFKFRLIFDQSLSQCCGLQVDNVLLCDHELTLLFPFARLCFQVVSCTPYLFLLVSKLRNVLCGLQDPRAGLESVIYFDLFQISQNFENSILSGILHTYTRTLLTTLAFIRLLMLIRAKYSSLYDNSVRGNCNGF